MELIYIRFHPFRSYLTSFLKVICRPCLAAFASHAYRIAARGWLWLENRWVYHTRSKFYICARLHQRLGENARTLIHTVLTRQFSLLRHFRRRCLENSQFIHNLKTRILYIYICLGMFCLRVCIVNMYKDRWASSHGCVASRLFICWKYK